MMTSLDDAERLVMGSRRGDGVLLLVVARREHVFANLRRRFGAEHVARRRRGT